MRLFLIAGSAPIIALNFWLAGGQAGNLVRAVIAGTPTGWIVLKATLSATLAFVVLVRLLISLDRVGVRERGT